MRSKIHILLLSLGLILSKAHDSEAAFPSHPLGIMLRPGLVSKLLNHFNDKMKMGEPIVFDFCHLSHYIKVSLSGMAGRFEWNGETNALIILHIDNLRAAGEHIDQCEIKEDPVTKETKIIVANSKPKQRIDIEIGPSKLGFTLNPRTMGIDFDSNSLNTARSQFSIKLPSSDKNEKTYAALEREINSPAILDFAFDALTTELKKYFSNYLLSTLRGLSFNEVAGKLLENNPLFQDEPILNSGGIQITLEAPSPKQKLITLAFAPFKNPAAFTSREGFELYLNAGFFSSDQVQILTGLDPLKAERKSVKAALDQILSDPARQPEFNSDRPSLSKSTADFSLMVPLSLIDTALTQIYRERLLGFRLKTDLGKQTKGIIAENEQDVSLMVTISPQSTPQLKFEADTLQVEVKDYLMDIGTYIEDRIIPSTQISNLVKIGAGLKVDAENGTVNLILKHDQFEVKLEDKKERLGEKSISFLQKIANSTWSDFLSSYSELVLFPTVIKPSDMELKIESISLNRNSLVLDMNVFLKHENKYENK